MFRFESLNYLNYILLLPILFFLSVYLYSKNLKLLKTHFGTMTVKLMGSFSYTKRKMKWLLQSLVLILFLVAMARPQLGTNQSTIKSRGFEIIFAVDVSESMMAEDIRPSRLEQVKLELSKLVDLMPGNKMGVIAFAGSSVLLSPLTNDVGAIKMYFDSLNTNMITNQGTNFESALKYAIESFERGGATQDSSSRVTKVILVASDGEDHEDGALKAAEDLSQKGIKIFTVAYGTEKGGTIPKRDQFGYLKGYKTDRSGQTIISTVRGDFLKKLAATGKGSFYFSTFGGTHIQNLVEDFNALEKQEFESKTTIDYAERFQWILLIGIILALIEILISEKNKDNGFWKGRYVDSKTK